MKYTRKWFLNYTLKWFFSSRRELKMSRCYYGYFDHADQKAAHCITVHPHAGLAFYSIFQSHTDDKFLLLSLHIPLSKTWSYKTVRTCKGFTEIWLAYSVSQTQSIQFNVLTYLGTMRLSPQSTFLALWNLSSLDELSAIYLYFLNYINHMM